MRRCRRCGFPRSLARSVEWHSDGTVVGSMGLKLPFMFLGVDERETVFAELSETIGYSVEEIFIEAQRNVGREIYEMARKLFRDLDLKRIPNDPRWRPQWFAKLVAWAARGQIAASGMGRMRVERYVAGECLRLRFSDPCLIPGLVGNCAGIYESLEEMPAADVRYHFEGDDLIIDLRHAAAAPERETRVYLEEVEAGTGPLAYERCPVCGVPVEIARSLIWDTKRGIMLNLETGERTGMVAVQSLLAILRELEIELGSDVIDIVYEAQKKYSLLHLSGPVTDPDAFWEAYLTDMAMRGQGYPSWFERSVDAVTVEISTAYDQDLYAAKIAAGLEHATGCPSAIDWHQRNPRHARYSIREKGV